MKRISRNLGLPTVLSGLLCLTAHVAPAADIVDTAVSAGSFNTLVAAVQAAGLVDTLKSEGPLTVFAPTDEAFAKLPAGTVEALLKPENKEQLIAVLTYHVVPGKLSARSVVAAPGLKSVNGQRPTIDLSDGRVRIDNAQIVKTDIDCSNGVIHVIDSVILPNTDDIPTTADKAGVFKTLLAAAQAAGLGSALAGEGPLTVFAPTDEAFAKLPAGTVETLLKPENKQKLVDILTYHVVSGKVYSDDALAAETAKTLQGQPVRISADSGAPRVNDAKLTQLDIDASNGVIHVIDKVLLPSAARKIGAKEGRRMIYDTIAKGSQLFNTGHHHACAELYMMTAKKMISNGDDAVGSLTEGLEHALTECGHTDCPIQRSWTMRHALDRAYFAMRAAETH